MDVRIFLVFLLGEGEGETETPGGGGGGRRFENPRKGRSSQERGNDRGAGRVSAGNLGEGGG